MGLLTPEEREKIAELVAELILGSTTALVPLLKSTHASRIAMDPRPIEYGINVVLYCEQCGWIEKPALIMRLLERWKFINQIALIIERLKHQSVPVFHSNDNVSATALLALTLPFIGRENTRKAAQGFFDKLISPTGKPDGIRVLIVNGGPGTGKTYTFNYINYINAVYTTQRFKSVYIDFGCLLSARLGPKELAETILKSMGINDFQLPVLDAQQQPRWNLDVARYVTAMTKNNLDKEQLWFLVMDRFDNAEVPRETIEFIQILATLATGELHSAEVEDCFRLILLGFKDPVTNFRKRVIEDVATSFTLDDLRIYFERYFTFRQMLQDAAAISLMVNKVMEPTQSGAPRTNQDMARRALKISESIS